MNLAFSFIQTMLVSKGVSCSLISQLSFRSSFQFHIEISMVLNNPIYPKNENL